MTKTDIATVDKATVPIVGLHCASCVKRTEEALRNIPGVAGANVNLALENAHVEYDPARSIWPPSAKRCGRPGTT